MPGEVLRELEKKPGKRTDVTSSDAGTGSDYATVADVLGVDAATVNRDLKPPVANATPQRKSEAGGVANATSAPDFIDSALGDVKP